jgi:protein pelota
MHVSGQQLHLVSGVAAILRYPLPDLDELEELATQHKEHEVVGEDEGYLSDQERRVREDLEDMGL